MLTTSHTPFDTRIFHKESKALAKGGHKVSIIAPSENDVSKEVEGIQIVPISKPKQRVLAFYLLWQLFIKGLKRECDAYHCHEPESLFMGVILKFLTRRKLVYDTHEDYPALVKESADLPMQWRVLLTRLVDLIERVFCRCADYVIIAHEFLGTRYQQLNDNVIFLYNYPSLRILDPQLNPEIESRFKDQNIIIYVGSMNRAKGALVSVKALPFVLAEIPSVKLLFVGGCRDDVCKREIDEFIKTSGLEADVEFIDWVPYTEALAYIKAAKIGILLFQPVPIYYNTPAIKLFEYMAMGVPVIGSDFPSIRKFVERAECGLLVDDPTEPKEVADTIIYLLTHPKKARKMGENGRNAVTARYNWEREEQKLGTMYNKLTEQ